MVPFLVFLMLSKKSIQDIQVYAVEAVSPLLSGEGAWASQDSGYFCWFYPETLDTQATILFARYFLIKHLVDVAYRKS